MDSNLKKLLQKLNREDDKLKTLIIDNLTIEKAFEGNSEVSLKVTNSMLNVHNMVHGGVLFTVADSSAGLACVSLGKKVVTLNSNINLNSASSIKLKTTTS